jgi:hypothetical protein
LRTRVPVCSQAALSRLRADKDRDIERLEAIVREHERKARITQDFLDRKEAMEAELQVRQR